LWILCRIDRILQPGLAPIVQELQAAGCESLRDIAAGLDERGIPAAYGGKWSAVQVARLLENAGLQSCPFKGASAARWHEAAAKT
jgi:hypothetical protein